MCEETERRLVRPTGFEPVAYSSGGCRSIQLSYGRNLVDGPRSKVDSQVPACQPKLASEETERRLVRPAGLEPAAYWFEASRSIQLSYGRTDQKS